jgi:magnesium chelatase family protein
MANQVETARQVQLERFTGDNGFSETGANGNMSPPEIRCHCRLQGAAEKLLKLAMEQMGLSARAHDRILRVSRTIADLSGDADIGEDHLSEAINFRALDRSYWN